MPACKPRFLRNAVSRIRAVERRWMILDLSLITKYGRELESVDFRLACRLRTAIKGADLQNYYNSYIYCEDFRRS